MSKWKIMITAVVLAGLIGFFSVGEPPYESGDPLAQLVAGPPPRELTDDEVDLYIAVYKAMQADRDLKIDEAIEPHAISLADFRDIERRVQMSSTLVDRVRRELVAHAEEISVFSPAQPQPAPEPQPAP